MNAPTITPAMIRRRPFAVWDGQIAGADEAWIARHMRASVTAEQQLRGNKPGAMPSPIKAQGCIDGREPTKSNNAKTIEADRRRADFVRRIGSKIVRVDDVAKMLNISSSAAGWRVWSMVQVGVLEVVGTDGKCNLYRSRKESAE